MKRCVFKIAGSSVGKHVHKCVRCGRTVAVTTEDSPAIKARCGGGPSPLEPKIGPGTSLEEMLAEWGVHKTGDCGCSSMARAMNLWGVEGCRLPQYRKLIAKKLKASAAKYGWHGLLVAGAMVRGGVALRINPLDPFGSLVDLAIERSIASTAGDAQSPSPAPPADTTS